MRQKTAYRLFIAIATTLGVSVQCVAADALSEDVVVGVTIASILNREFKAECELRFPDLKERVDKAFDAAPINSVAIHEYIDGREYRNPAIHSVIALKREMTKDGQYGAAKRTDCEDPEMIFSHSTKQFLREHEKQDYQELLDWAANGKPPSAQEKNPISLDMKAVSNMQNKAFLDAYPSEIRSRSLYMINLVRYVQLAQFVAFAIKSQCDERWPDRKAAHDSAYQGWPYASVKALTIVNGRAYDNPYVAPAARQYWMPKIFGSDERSQEAACKDLSGTLEKVSWRAELKWFPILLELLTVPQ